MTAHHWCQIQMLMLAKHVYGTDADVNASNPFLASHAPGGLDVSAGHDGVQRPVLHRHDCSCVATQPAHEPSAPTAPPTQAVSMAHILTLLFFIGRS
jgi:hypothetical protein